MDVAVWVLLGVVMAAGVLTALGLLLGRDVYDRLHYMSVAASVGMAAAAAAVMAREGFSAAGLKAILAALVVVVMNPILSHATARAARIHEHGAWQPRPGDEDR